MITARWLIGKLIEWPWYEWMNLISIRFCASLWWVFDSQRMIVIWGTQKSVKLKLCCYRLKDAASLWHWSRRINLWWLHCDSRLLQYTVEVDWNVLVKSSPTVALLLWRQTISYPKYFQINSQILCMKNGQFCAVLFIRWKASGSTFVSTSKPKIPSQAFK